jgi:methyl-accepting chemotaxis protein
MKRIASTTCSRFFLAGVFLVATSSAWAAPDCAGLDSQVNVWQTYLQSYGSPALLNVAGILAYGQTVTNGNDRVLNARHKTDVSTIFVKNLAGDFVRVATSVPDGVEGSHQPAVGTTLTHGGASWTALTAGAEFCGTVSLFGTSYDTVYRPIWSNGVVIGALFVGNVTQ